MVTLYATKFFLVLSSIATGIHDNTRVDAIIMGIMRQAALLP